MMKATKFAVVLLAAGLTVGCASKSDITNLQTQIDGLKADMTSVKSTADQAASDAQSAAAAANKAAAAAQRAEDAINAKLDRGVAKGFRK
jgi:outer membrane murein-binding lipoprotein Lpp